MDEPSSTSRSSGAAQPWMPAVTSGSQRIGSKTTVINISLPERLLHLVDQRAQDEARSRSDLFREAVRRYLGLSTVATAPLPPLPVDTAPTESSEHQVAGFVGAGGGDLTWRVFRIMAEFVEGYHFLHQFQKTVTFFGSARVSIDDHWYQEAAKLGSLLAREGFTIITGGGPGIMEAGNRGAVEGGGESVGLNIQLPTEQRTNPYVKKATAFDFFFTRKVMLMTAAQAYVFFPGGFGTLDEFFELITLEQTGKVERHVPIVLVGREHWQPLCDWMNREFTRQGFIDPGDTELWQIVDSVDEALPIITASQPRSRLIYSSKEAHAASGDGQVWSQ